MSERRVVRYREEWNPTIIGFLTPTVILITAVVLYGGLDIYIFMMGFVILGIGAVTGLATERIARKIPHVTADIVAILITTVGVALWNVIVEGFASLGWLLNIGPTVLVGSGVAVVLRKFHVDLKLGVLTVIATGASVLSFLGLLTRGNMGALLIIAASQLLIFAILVTKVREVTKFETRSEFMALAMILVGVGLGVFGFTIVMLAAANPFCIPWEDAMRVGLTFHCVPNLSWEHVDVVLATLVPGIFLFSFGRAYALRGEQ